MAIGISALILNYGAPKHDLERCVRSLLNSSGLGATESAILREVLIVDNASLTHRDAPVDVAQDTSKESPIPVRVLQLGRNWGFAGGINRGLQALDQNAEWVLLLNNDAVVEPRCLAEAAAVAVLQPAECVAVAPKMLLAQHPHHIDAVGNCVNERGEAFNVGIGQLDIGQYDRTELCLGPCFGAALIRRRAFDADMVGRLDESLFLYYEDVDWNWRATMFGYTSVTAPKARVHHTLSGSTRHLDYSFKFRLQERNLLLVTAKNFEARRALAVWRRRTGGHLRGALTGHFPLGSLRANAGAWRHGPGALRERRALQARRTRTDDDVIAFSTGERPFIDPVTYTPERTLAALAHAYRRRAAVIGDASALRIAEMCAGLDGTAGRSLEPDLVVRRLMPLLDDEPDHARAYVRALSHTPVR